MNSEKKLNILEIVILLSPLIDLITSLTVRLLNLNLTFGMIFRFAFLLYLLYYLIFKTKNKYKKISIIYLIVLIVFSLIHLLNIYYLKGFTVLLIEFKTIIKIFYFPIVLITIFNYLIESKFNERILKLVSIIYLSLIFLPYITKTAFITYSIDKIGSIGWFYAGNEIGAIVAILAPFTIAKIFNDYNKWYSYIFLTFYSFVMLLIGTKVPFLGLTLPIFTYLIVYIIRFIINKTSFLSFIKTPIIIPVILSLIIIFTVYKYSSLKLNINQHKNILIEQNNLNPELKKDDYLNLIFSSRDKYFSIMQKKYKLANTKEKLIGLGYVDPLVTFNKSFNIIEVDYGDVFYLYGIIGFLIYFSSLFIIIFQIIIMSFKKFKTIIFDDKILPYYISCFLILGIAFFAGHIFTAPAVSLFPALIISKLFLKLKTNEGIV